MKTTTKSKDIRLSQNALRVLEKRYLRRNATGDVTETPEQMFRRVAANISEAELNYDLNEENRERWEETFFDVMTRLDFLPNSPTLMNAGTEIQQLSACFVLPVEDSMETIFESVKDAALIHKSGGGTGFSFSRLRPKNDLVKSTKGVSSGPVSFMKVFDTATEAVKQGGRRRGANMAILRVDHPDILEFVGSKTENDRLTNFNISVALTDAFMKAVTDDTEYDLINPRDGTVAGRLDARDVFDKVVDGAWRNGEPGIVFIDLINRDNPTPALGDIESTNPCGEQPLLPYESCNLGSINLRNMVRTDTDTPVIDYDKIAEVVNVAVRFLDDVIDMNRYPISKITDMTKANRKVGLGVMGFAEMLVQMGIPYDSDEAVSTASAVMAFIQNQSLAASVRLAEERGPFPAFDGSAYDGGPPLRNATRTTIAPTGSISIIANTSSGVEPMFALVYKRTVMDGDELVEVNPIFESVARREGFYDTELMAKIAGAASVRDFEEIPSRWRDVFCTAHDLAPEGHVRIQAAFQKHTDNAVSKTVNLPHDATREDVRDVFVQAYDLACKGVTVYRDGSREGQVLSVGEKKTPSDGVQPAPRRRPDITTGSTRKVTTGCGNLYVTINEENTKPFELFAQIGKTGGCAASQTEAIGRLVSLALRAGVDPDWVVQQLRGVRCPAPARQNGTMILSCADGISKALEAHLKETQPSNGNGRVEEAEPFVNRLAGLCMECGNVLEFDGGCSVCRMCGYSRCA